jgi:hypothetical protein
MLDSADTMVSMEDAESDFLTPVETRFPFDEDDGSKLACEY